MHLVLPAQTPSPVFIYRVHPSSIFQEGIGLLCTLRCKLNNSMDGSVSPQSELVALFPPLPFLLLHTFSHPLCNHLRLCLLSPPLGAICHYWIGDAPALPWFSSSPPVPPLLQLGLWPLETVAKLASPDHPRGMNFLAASPSAALPTPLVLMAHAVPLMRQEPSRLCWRWGLILLRDGVMPLSEMGDPWC